jgi:formate dehydrogenase gamma subunit
MSTLTLFDRNEKKSFVRWALNERVQHWVLAISFAVLVVTGFALKYPDSWWVRPFLALRWFADFRSLLHRIAGGAFVLLGFYHMFYMLATKRGRGLVKAFRPGLQDLRDLSQNVAYNLGRQKHPPKFGHFSYMEKAEYLALIWGAVIMGVTGLMLWFEGFTLNLFHRWVIDLVTVIHLYEAWLATLAIVVWHFYYVIFNPDVYPLSTGMLDGRITAREMREEHFLEWQELRGDGKTEVTEQEDEKASPISEVKN